MAKKPIKPKAASAKTAKKTTKRVASPHLYRERYPDKHNITGKYTFLYMFFAFTTLVFALTTIYLYSVTHDIVRRYDEFIQYSKENGNKYEGEDNE